MLTRKRPFRGSGGGFTLIEIMVVVAIIGILMSMVSFFYSKIKMDVYEKSCNQNMRTIFGSAQLYWIENGSLPANHQQLTCRLLCDDGYLKKIPKCPWAGKASDPNEAFYTITGESKDKVIVTCINRVYPKYAHGVYKFGDKK